MAASTTTAPIVSHTFCCLVDFNDSPFRLSFYRFNDGLDNKEDLAFLFLVQFASVIHRLIQLRNHVLQEVRFAISLKTCSNRRMEFSCIRLAEALHPQLRFAVTGLDSCGR